MTIYTGEDARTACERILENIDYSMAITGYDSASAGYWEENGKWVAYDNTDGECWMEEFATEAEAKGWIDGGENDRNRMKGRMNN